MVLLTRVREWHPPSYRLLAISIKLGVSHENLKKNGQNQSNGKQKDLLLVPCMGQVGVVLLVISKL